MIIRSALLEVVISLTLRVINAWRKSCSPFLLSLVLNLFMLHSTEMEQRSSQPCTRMG